MVDVSSLSEFLDTKVSMSVLLSSVVVSLGLSYTVLALGSSKRNPKQSRGQKQILGSNGTEENEGWETDESADGSPGILDSFGRDDGELMLMHFRVFDFPVGVLFFLSHPFFIHVLDFQTMIQRSPFSLCCI